MPCLIFAQLSRSSRVLVCSIILLPLSQPPTTSVVVGIRRSRSGAIGVDVVLVTHPARRTLGRTGVACIEPIMTGGILLARVGLHDDGPGSRLVLGGTRSCGERLRRGLWLWRLLVVDGRWVVDCRWDNGQYGYGEKVGHGRLTIDDGHLVDVANAFGGLDCKPDGQ